MENLSKYFLSTVLIIVFVTMVGCNKKDVLYKRTYAPEEKAFFSDALHQGAGNTNYYQGTVAERFLIMEGDKLVPDKAFSYREMGIPYLKRGMGSEANDWYTKAANRDPKAWAGYLAYCWLYFYRDYDRCIAECNRLDSLTPDFVDYPQSTSVNYMRGLSHLQKGEYDVAIDYLREHLDFEIESVGESYVEAIPFLILGVAYHKKGAYEKAEEVYKQGVKYNNNCPDLHYYRALNSLKLGNQSLAISSTQLAEKYFDVGNKNIRPYVEEFYAIYGHDIENLKKKVNL